MGVSRHDLVVTNLVYSFLSMLDYGMLLHILFISSSATLEAARGDGKSLVGLALGS